ncbi:hypothetical protein, partial [Caballeronia sp. GAFFF3]|uniref:hypothetical protein n=1 Tax=Caballeronia sp. GAFFF3 TaxID=2921759 RepID=UPI002028B886
LVLEDERRVRNDIQGRVGIVNSDSIINWSNALPTGYPFLVYLISKVAITQNLPIPNISSDKHLPELNLMSLSSIIYDASDILVIPDG